MPAPAQPLSAADVIAPAFERMKTQLFSPFRWGYWLRMAVVGFLAGETGGGLNFPSSFNISERSGSGRHLLAASDLPFRWGPGMLPWLIVLAVAVVALIFVFLYLHSIFRFILFDSVLIGDCSIRRMWTRRQEIGQRYFLWLIFFQLGVLFIFCLVVGIPLLSWWRSGVFENPQAHLGTLIGGGLLLLPIILLLAAIAAVITVIVRDFLIPRMALEGLSVGEAWSQAKPGLAAEKGKMVVYFLLKLLLNIAFSIALGIASFLVILVLMIPAVIIGALFFAVFSSGGAKGAAMAVLVVLIGLLVLAFVALIIFVIALFSVPAAVFFQSYALYFVGSRYPALAKLLWPEQPAPPVSPPAPLPLVPGPPAEPAPA